MRKLPKTIGNLPIVLFAAGLLLCGCESDRHKIPTADKAPLTQGGRLFESYCSACHLSDGRGRDGGGPPLAGSPWVAGSERRLIRIVLHGLRGPIEVGNVTYRREMLGFGQILNDAQIAELLSEVRHRFGNSSEPISPETVAEVRASTPERTEYWTVEELLNEW